MAEIEGDSDSLRQASDRARQRAWEAQVDRRHIQPPVRRSLRKLHQKATPDGSQVVARNGHDSSYQPRAPRKMFNSHASLDLLDKRADNWQPSFPEAINDDLDLLEPMGVECRHISRALKFRISRMMIDLVLH